MCREMNYLDWRQDAPWLNESEAWPRSVFPDAEYTLFQECGCLVCSLAVMLRHAGIEKTEKELFNPWILNQRLIACGAFTSAADLILKDIRKLYPLDYVGPVPFSLRALEQIIGSGSPCLVTVPGIRSARHFITPLELRPDDVAVFDPLCGETNLGKYKQVIDIREFRYVSITCEGSKV